MNTLRNGLKSNYSQIPNEIITDLNLCNGSMRVLLYLFTKPDSWNVYNKDICKRLNISEQTLTKYWKILIKSGWLKREISKNKDGKLTGGYDYLIGKFTVSIQSTDSVNSIEHSNNKLLKKEVTSSKEYESLKNMWNRYSETSKSPKISIITSKRKIKIQSRLKEYSNLLEMFDRSLYNASNSKYLKDKSWFSFDWLIENDTNIVKVFEGKYNNESKSVATEWSVR